MSKHVIKGHSDIVPVEYEITPDKNGVFFQADKCINELGDGYGPGAFKLFVQPVPKRYLDVLKRTLEFLLPEEDVSVKFMGLAVPQNAYPPEQERIVIYTKSWQELRDKIARLCDGFGVECYLFGSASDMTSGRYHEDYGARFTQQINPMLHLRVGGRVLHEGLNARAVMVPLNDQEKKFLDKYTGNENPDTQESRELLTKMKMAEDFMRDMGDYSLEKSGILEIGFEDTRCVLDPRIGYTIGRGPDSHIVLAEEGVSRKHAVISYKPGTGYFLTDVSTNGTYVNGNKITRSPIKKNDSVRFHRTEALIKGAMY